MEYVIKSHPHVNILITLSADDIVRLLGIDIDGLTDRDLMGKPVFEGSNLLDNVVLSLWYEDQGGYAHGRVELP